MKDVSGLLRAAVGAQQNGDLREARRLYEQALRAAPRNADALHLLGLTWLDEGQHERGLQLIRRAIAYRPDYLEAINNIAIELAKLERHAEALVFLEKALQLNAAQPDVHYNMGRALNALGRFEEALPHYDQALAAHPGHYEAWNNRGLTQQALKDLPAAMESYDRALALKPDFAEAWTNRGATLHALGRYAEALDSIDNAIAARPDFRDAWVNRGNSLQELGRDAEALAAFDKALAGNPDDSEALINRSIALHALRRFDEALACQERVLARAPDNATAWIARGVTLHRLRRLEEALACSDRAIVLQPGDYMAWSNRGAVLNDTKRTEDAVAAYDRAIALEPEAGEAQQNRGYSLLSLGRFAEGWRGQEYRWRTKGFRSRRPDVAAPAWQGEELTGRHILVYTEQGMGDAIQFIRYVPLLQARGARVTVLCPANLHLLLKTAAPEAVFVGSSADVGAVDFHAALMSLPGLFGTNLGNIPGGVPYLAADPELVAQWRGQIGAAGYRVGISWQGNPSGGVDIGRSFPLAQYAMLADLPGLRLISLQKNAGSEQIAQLPAGMAVEDLGPAFDAGADAFADCAAVMQALDLVITSDTAIAHLAGALGRPVWVALQYVPDWRWMHDREDSPWYPSMRLFRQGSPGDWAGVFAAIRGELEQAMTSQISAVVAAPLVPTSWGELLDKITILEIKAERISAPPALANVRRELAALNDVAAAVLAARADVLATKAELKSVNEALWDIEDRIREHERAQDFGAGFIELARAVYRTNDRRGELKRRINALLGSALVEEKHYAAY